MWFSFSATLLPTNATIIPCLIQREKSFHTPILPKKQLNFMAAFTFERMWLFCRLLFNKFYKICSLGKKFCNFYMLKPLRIFAWSWEIIVKTTYALHPSLVSCDTDKQQFLSASGRFFLKRQVVDNCINSRMPFVS